MISITKFYKSITEYAKLGKANVFPVKYGCKNCGYEGRLHRHGFYSRNVITRFTIHRVYILRVKCPSCNRTYSVLPSFLIPYYQYSFDFVFLCLYYSYVAGYSYARITGIFRSFCPHTSFSTSNVYYLRKRMKGVAPLVRLFFVRFTEFYYDMDNPSIASVILKIETFIKTRGDFNYCYFENMPVYFLARV